jgi:hypothetical protein
LQIPLQLFNVHYKCSTATTSTQQNTRFLRSRCLVFKRRSATALLQVKQGYWSYKPPLQRTYKICHLDFFPTIRSTRENEEITTDELHTRTTSHVSSTKNSPFFCSRVAGFAKQPIWFEVLAPASLFLQRSHMQRENRKRTTLRSKSSTSKGLLYAPDPDNHEKGTLRDQPRLWRVSSTVLMCCWGRSRSKI